MLTAQGVASSSFSLPGPDSGLCRGWGSPGAGAWRLEPGSRGSHTGAGSVRCRAAGGPRRPEPGREGECGEGSGSRKQQPPPSPFTGRADRVAGSFQGSQAHASLPDPLEVSKVGLRGVGAEGAGSHVRTLVGQVSRMEGPEGLCTSREPSPGPQPHPSPSSSPSTSRPPI